MDIVEQLKAKGLTVDLTGSKAICNPAPVDTDTDYLVYCPRDTEETAEIVFLLTKDDGWMPEGDQEHYEVLIESSFVSLRKDKINLIVTNQEWFAKRHRIATQVCKKLNLLNKDDRIMVFKAILYGDLEGNTRKRKKLEAA